MNAAELGTYDHAKHLLIPHTGDNFWVSISASLNLIFFSSFQFIFEAHLGASGIAGVSSAIVSTPGNNYYF